MALLIRNEENIIGLKFGNTTYKISLFADDATCLLADVESIEYTFRITDKFGKYSGLKLNIEKSQLTYIGPWKVKPNIIFEIQIVKGSFNMLGVEKGSDTFECTTANFTDKIAKMTTKLNTWSQRQLTLIGYHEIHRYF